MLNECHWQALALPLAVHWQCASGCFQFRSATGSATAIFQLVPTESVAQHLLHSPLLRDAFLIHIFDKWRSCVADVLMA